MLSRQGHELDAGYREHLSSSLLAYQRARARREAAQQVEEDALRVALFDSGNCRLSVREIAALVRLPKTTVARLLPSASTFHGSRTIPTSTLPRITQPGRTCRQNSSPKPRSQVEPRTTDE